MVAIKTSDMISKGRIRLIHSLEMRKFRKEQGLFVAEGPKLVGELLRQYQPKYIAALPSWIEANQDLFENTTCDVLTQDELQRASLLRSPQEVIALFPIPCHILSHELLKGQLSLALDGVQDPGNLGTICRIADWFGISHILCSTDTVDIYNPKSVQATMGALAHVKLHYVDLKSFLSKSSLPLYGTFLDGENIYERPLHSEGIIVMGNEGKGVSPEVAELVHERLFIPNYPTGRVSTESLNVAIATSIVCAEFRRRCK